MSSFEVGSKHISAILTWAIAIYKLARCWSYNSCDHKYNEQDLVWLEMAKIEKQASAISGLSEETILDSEEGEQAPWCYSDKDWKKYIAWVRERQTPKLVSPKVVVFATKARIKAVKTHGSLKSKVIREIK